MCIQQDPRCDPHRCSVCQTGGRVHQTRGRCAVTSCCGVPAHRARVWQLRGPCALARSACLPNPSPCFRTLPRRWSNPRPGCACAAGGLPRRIVRSGAAGGRSRDL